MIEIATAQQITLKGDVELMGTSCWINSSRNSRIEGLRCVAMLLVVMSHSSVHGMYPSQEFSLNRCVLDWITLGNLGTDIFVLLSGWNLSGKSLKQRSVIKLIMQVWSISLLGTCIYALSGNAITSKDVFRTVFPLMSDSWWFATTYVVLLLLTPYINAFVSNVNRKKFEHCLITMLFLWSFIPMISTQDMGGGKLAQTILLYLIGVYLKLYPNNIFSNSRIAIPVFSASIVLVFLSSVTIRWVSINVVSLPFDPDMLYSRTSVLIIACAVSVVALSVYAPAYSNRLINTIGATTFGIYLLHEHPLIKCVLWTEWMNSTAFFKSNTFVMHIMSSVVAVFTVCGVVEWLRLLFIAKPVEVAAEKVINMIGKKMKSVRQGITES